MFPTPARRSRSISSATSCKTPRLPPEELSKELDVIRREMDMNQDDPGRRAGRRLFECAYTKSPYRFTIIGYPDIFDTLKPEDILGYYREKYVPNNMFFIVTGDIKKDEVVAQIRAAFARSKGKALPPQVLPREPRQTAPREIVEEGPIELAYFHLAWHIPDVRHPDTPALDILAACSAAGAVPACSGKCARNNSWSFPLMPGRIVPANRASSA